MIRTAVLLPAVIAAAPLWADPITVTDSLGRSLAFDRPPERVVALYNDAYGQLATLGIRPVGVLVNPEMTADGTYFLPDATTIPSVAGADSFDAEAIAALDPDLIIAWGPEEVAALEGIAPVYATAGIATFDDTKADLLRLGTLFGVADVAQDRIAAFEARLAAYAAIVGSRDTTILKLGASDGGRFEPATINDPVCGVLFNAVGTCDWPDPSGATGAAASWSYETGIETIVQMNPDVIVLNNWSSMTTADLLASLNQNPLWAELDAVRNGRVVFLEDYSNPIASSVAAAVKTLDLLVPAIYPDLFPTGPLTEDQVAAALAQE
jgi:iron complex transport system substrate-binding protein